MKTIGILGGMTWHSTVEYYRLLNELINKRKGEQNAARVLIYSFNFQELRNWQLTDINELTLQLAKEAKTLEKAGAELLLIGANTMHQYYDQIQDAINIPVLHIADAVAKNITEAKLKKVLLLGTKYTMQGSFYKDRLATFGIEAITPNTADQIIINNVIYNELTLGIIDDNSRTAYLNIIDKIKADENVEGIILGCTEIPLLIKPEHTNLKIFSTTEIHAISAVDYALSNK